MRADFKQFEAWHKKLRKLSLWVEASIGVEFTITSPHRLNDEGVHGQLPLRAIDLRMRNKKVGLAIVEHINDHWQYDYERLDMKCAVLHGEGPNLHIHLQVHRNTR